MRKRVLAFVSIVVVVAAASGASASVVPQAELRTASADEHALARTEAAPLALKPAGQRGVEDLRDCAALVLVGSMLIGLAAAVRRTA